MQLHLAGLRLFMKPPGPHGKALRKQSADAAEQVAAEPVDSTATTRQNATATISLWLTILHKLHCGCIHSCCTLAMGKTV